jgi:protein-S-isoprenylcysteine O-methyltransferase Ste14
MILPRYLVCTALLLSAAYLILRLLFHRDYTHRGRLSPLSQVAGSLVFFLWGGFPYLYGPSDWPAVHLSAPLRILGWSLLAGGLAIMLAGIWTLSLPSALGQGSRSLAQHGLYRYSRNPQLLGCCAYGLGFALLWPSWYALGWVLMFAVLAHLMVITEEEHLGRVFGQEYQRYCQRVPRYLGLQQPERNP